MIKTKKKNFVILLILICVVIVLLMIGILAPGYIRPNYLEISSIVELAMEDEGLIDCHLKSMSDYSGIMIQLESPVISDEELDEYVEKNYNYDLTNEELTEIKSELLTSQKIETISKARKEIITQLFELSEFDLNEETIITYSLQIIHSYETEAYIYGFELDEYIEKKLGMNHNDFYNKCYAEGEDVVKTYLIMGAIYKSEFSDEEVEGANIYLKYQNLMNKVYSLFIHVDDNF